MFCHNPFKILFGEANRIQTERILYLVKEVKEWTHLMTRTIQGWKKKKEKKNTNHNATHTNTLMSKVRVGIYISALLYNILQAQLHPMVPSHVFQSTFFRHVWTCSSASCISGMAANLKLNFQGTEIMILLSQWNGLVDFRSYICISTCHQGVAFWPSQQGHSSFTMVFRRRKKHCQDLQLRAKHLWNGQQQWHKNRRQKSSLIR